MTTFETVTIGIATISLVISSFTILAAKAAERSALAAEAQAEAARNALSHLKEANEISALTFWQSQLESNERALVSIRAVAEAFDDVKQTQAAFSDPRYPSINAADALITKGTCSLAVADASPDQIAIRGTTLLAAIRAAFAPVRDREAQPSAMLDAELALTNIFTRIEELNETIPEILVRREAEMARAQSEIARLEASRAKSVIS